MQPNRKEIETIARVRGLNHEEGVFRDRILVNYERMRLAMERVGLLLEVRLHSKDLDFGEYIFQKVEHDLDILEDQIAVLDTLIDLWQLQEF